MDAALRYIEEHKEEVMARYKEGLEFAARGNSPEIKAVQRARRPLFKKLVAAIRAIEDQDPATRQAKVSRLIKEYQETLRMQGDTPQPAIVMAAKPDGR